MIMKFPRVLRPPTIRTLVVLWAGSALPAWAILATGWSVAEHQLSVIGGQVVANIRALDTTRKLESAVLSYRHEDLLWYATRQSDHHRRSHEYLRTADQIAQDLARYIDALKERELWTAIQERLKALHEQPEAPALTAEVQAWPASGLSALIQDFEVQNEAQMEQSIQADADRINRVLMNLVSNAVKYSPRETRVTLRVEKSDSQAVLTVSDQGPGIAPDDLKVLFQPFGRGRSADSLAEGTGMGLYVVKQIVEAHDGKIEVHSEPGHGATLEIRLPLVKMR